jgi:hypothetical protein
MSSRASDLTLTSGVLEIEYVSRFSSAPPAVEDDRGHDPAEAKKCRGDSPSWMTQNVVTDGANSRAAVTADQSV